MSEAEREPAAADREGRAGPDGGRRWQGPAAALGLAAVLLAATAARAVERFPPPEFESGHTLPRMTQPPPRAGFLGAVDVAVLLVALALAAFFLLRRRSRPLMVILSVGSLGYFGFYRQGCICPIGAIQNVSLALFDGGYVVPLTVLAFFLLPLVFALFFGRVFCGGVCPLGAMQDLLLLRPVRLPRWLDHALRPVPFVYLGLAVLLAATGSMFIICRYDPFVSFFRLAGLVEMLAAGGVVLLISMFVMRPYCRFLCPYGALLSMLSRFTWKGVRIYPDGCVACRLCEDACPLGAITGPEPGTAAREGAQ